VRQNPVSVHADCRRMRRSRLQRGRTLASWRPEPGLAPALRWHRKWEVHHDCPTPHPVLRLAVFGAVSGRGGDLKRVLTLRVPEELLRRLGAYASQVQTTKVYMRLSRADVIRMLLDERLNTVGQ
jgi:hypothetical protein